VSVAEQRDCPNSEEPREGGARLFRAMNERIRELEGDRLVGEYDFFCECEDETCTGVLRLSAQEYESVRADPNWFAVLPGHERPTDEVIRRSEHFLIVGTGGDGDSAQKAGSEAPNRSERR
jgi:hypothetical protein